MSEQSFQSSSISLNLKHEPGKAAQELERMLESSDSSSNEIATDNNEETVHRDYVVLNDLSELGKWRAEENESFVMNEETEEEENEEEGVESLDEDAERQVFRRPPSLINTDDLLKDSQGFLGTPKIQPKRRKKGTSLVHSCVVWSCVGTGILLTIILTFTILVNGTRVLTDADFSPIVPRLFRPRENAEGVPCEGLSQRIVRKLRSSGSTDCHKLHMLNESLSDGAYRLKLKFGLSSIKYRARCDMTSLGGGWTVFQRRGDFANPEDFFDKNWDQYVKGFGDEDGEYWLGLDLIAKLSSDKDNEQELLIQLYYADGRTDYAYDHFSVSHDGKYELSVGQFAGNTNDSLSYNDGQAFSTFDHDMDKSKGMNCANKRTGGWWFRNCSPSLLNGLGVDTTKTENRLRWDDWDWSTGRHLIGTEMKIRPRDNTTNIYSNILKFKDRRPSTLKP